jgi:uncharacterized membrane protein YgcG
MSSVKRIAIPILRGATFIVTISKCSRVLAWLLLAIVVGGLTADAAVIDGLEPAPKHAFSPIAVGLEDLAQLSMRITDLAAVLNPNYRADLDSRLTRLADKSGYAIHILLMPGDYEGSLVNIAAGQFDLKKLETSSSAGTVLVVIATRDSRVETTTSKNLRGKLSSSDLEREIQSTMLRHSKEPEQAIECIVNAVLVAIDPWFYVLPSPGPNVPASLVRFPTAEIILMPLAPFAGLMVGIILMAFTSAGNFPWLGRFFLSGYLACFIVVGIAFAIRQPGGILPGMLYYSAIMSFLVGGSVGALRTHWFADTFKGKTSDAWWGGPVHFRWG